MADIQWSDIYTWKIQFHACIANATKLLFKTKFLEFDIFNNELLATLQDDQLLVRKPV